jgi:multicomponent Na+:H+ antiporter subunit B
MNSLIFRTIAPLLTAVMLVFSVFVLLRGHNEPGGGFIGGLVAASALAIYGMAMGVDEVHKALKAHPVAYAGFGVVLATLAGALSIAFDMPFLTGLWTYFDFDGVEVALSTVLFFDIGVYFVVFGTVGAIALGLTAEDGEGD